jgi:PAS domain S-box-containing protein
MQNHWVTKRPGIRGQGWIMDSGTGTKTPHILILEDDTAHRELCLRAFRDDPELFRVSIAGSIREARQVVERDPPDLIIADWILPDGKGLDILPRTDGKVTVPLVIMTSFGDEHLAVEIMKSGAIDYVVKSATVFHDLPHIARRALRDWENIRQRKRAEETVQESQKRLADIIGFLPDAVLAIDNDGRVIAWNEAIEQMTGVTAADMLGKGDHEYSIPFYGERRPILIDLVQMDDPEIEKKYDFIHRNNGQLTTETFIPTPFGGKGTYLWGTAAPLYDSAGNRSGAIEVIRDITERKRVQQDLQNREATLEILLNAPRDSIALLDPQGTIIRTNKENAHRLGGTIESVTGRCVFDLLPPDIARARKEYVDTVFRTGEPVEFNDARSGRYLHNEIYPVFNPERTAVENVAIFARDITEQKRAELALQDSETRFRDLFSNMSAGVVIYETTHDGMDFIIRDINRAVETIEQVKKSEIIGKTVLEAFPGVKEFGLYDVFQRVEKTGIAESHPVSMYHDNRISGWRENYVYKLPSGEIVAIYEDVTEKKQAEEEARAAREWLGIALRAARAGTWDWDMPTGQLTWSPEFFELFGLLPGVTASFETWLAALHPDDREKAQAKIDQSVRDHSNLWNEYRIILPGGEFRWIGAAGSTIYNENGEPQRMSGVCIDITNRKLAEAKLRESEERYLSLFNRSLDGIYIHDLEGNFIDANASALELLGYSREEIPHVSFQSLLDPDELDRAKNAVETIVRDGSHSGLIEYRLKRRDGSYADIETKGTLIVHDGKPYGVFGIARDITERKQAEEQLRESEIRFREIFNKANDGIELIEVGENGFPEAYIDVNETACRMGGYTREELLKKRPADIDTGIYNRPFEDIIREIQTLGHATIESGHRRKDGTIYPIEINTHRITLGGREVLLSIIRDITERKRADEVLRTAETRFRALIQNSSDIIRILDVQGRVVYESASAERILGYPSGFMTGRDPMEYVHPDDFERVKNDFGEVLDRTNPGTPTEFRIRTADGEYLWVDSVGTNLLDVPGVNGIVITTRPVQQRKEAEQALLENQARLATAMDIAGLVNWEFEVATGMFTLDDRFYALYGTTVDREGGNLMPAETYMREFVYPDDRPAVLESIQKILATTDPDYFGQIEHRITPRDGSVRTIIARFAPVMGPDGKVVRTIGANQDITDRILMESEIRSLNTVLEQRVKDRTEAFEKANKALEEEVGQRQEAERKLQGSYDEKVMLLKEIHHRVKNNLQIIASLLNLQSRYIKDESTLAAIRESQNRVKAMALVHEKLYRSEDISHVSLHDYIRFLGSGLFQFYDAKLRGIQFMLEIHEVNVDIDAAIPLGLILNELISNSLKYAFPEGRKGEIFISVKKEDHTITVLFRDNGIGIPADLDWRDTQSLGLRLVNTLVDQMNGTVELDRSSGTQFTMVLHEKEPRGPS